MRDFEELYMRDFEELSMRDVDDESGAINWFKFVPTIVKGVEHLFGGG